MKVFFFFLLFSFSAQAYIAPVGIRSPKGLLMGDAWTSVANDDFTLFYNPAALARHQRDFTFYPINPSVGGTNILGDMDRFDNLPDTPEGISDVMMNYPVHISTHYVPGFKLFNFGFSFIAAEQADLLLRNKIAPTLNVDYRSDRGFVTGLAIPLTSGRVSGKSVSGQQTTLGFSAKYIKRRGIYNSFALTGTEILDAINNGSEIEDILDRLGMVQGSSWGFDGAFEHMVRNGTEQFVVSLVGLDILNTEFSVPKGSTSEIAPNRQQINLGAAWHHRSSLLRSTLSLEFRELTQERELLERTRLGLELGIPGISLLGGFNAGYYSYGVSVDAGAMKLTGGFYGLETGGGYRRIQSKRFIIYLSLFDFSFDA